MQYSAVRPVATSKHLTFVPTPTASTAPVAEKAKPALPLCGFSSVRTRGGVNQRVGSCPNIDDRGHTQWQNAIGSSYWRHCDISNCPKVVTERQSSRESPVAVCKRMIISTATGHKHRAVGRRKGQARDPAAPLERASQVAGRGIVDLENIVLCAHGEKSAVAARTPRRNLTGPILIKLEARPTLASASPSSD